jgi:hypothetical protein
VKTLNADQIEALMGVSSLSTADLAVGSARISSLMLNPSYSDPGGAGASVTITLGSGASFTWNGAGDNGQMLGTGNYFVELTATQPNSGTQEMTWTITILKSGNDSVAGAVLAPNPVRLNQTQTAQFLINVAAGVVDNVHIDFYTLAGELMKNPLVAPVSMGANTVNWNVGSVNIASGVYIAVIQFKSGNQLISRQILRVAIIR